MRNHKRVKLIGLAVLIVAGMVMMTGVLWADEGAATVNKSVQSEVSTSENADATPSAPASGQDINEKYFGGMIENFSAEPEITYMYVKGNRGQFRQDNWMDDQTTGGLRDISFEGQYDDVTYEYEGRFLINYDYLSRVHVEKEDGKYLNTEWKLFRKYWDGSQDTPWDPTQYRLPAEFGDWEDEDLHTDRGDVKTELGLPLSETAKLIIGHELWTREGRDVLLKGEQAVRTGLVTLRNLSMRRRVDGVSNTIYARLPFTVREIHNIEPSISFEAYRDSQFVDSARYTNGLLNQKRDYNDNLSFNDLKAQLKYDSFLRDDVYVHGGYFFNFLENDSVRTELRPNVAVPEVYVNPATDVWRVSNGYGMGAAVLDFLKKKGLDVRLGFRGEHSISDGHGKVDAGVQQRVSDSGIKESWFGEAMSITYRGIARTTAYASLDLEQSRIFTEETFDARSHEAVTVYGSRDLFPHYESYIHHYDIIPRIRLTHRLNSLLRAFGEYRYKKKDRYQDPTVDSDPFYYPGFLGDQHRKVHEITAKLDARLPAAWMSTLKYQLLMDDIEYPKVGNDQQNLDKTRLSMVLSGPIIQKLFGSLIGMYEYYRVDTPTNQAGDNRWAVGGNAYDFNGDVYLLGTNFNYLLGKGASLFANFQHTNSLGDNDNTLNEVASGIRYKMNDSTSFEAKYQFYKFADNRGFDTYDDDYLAQGFTLSLKKAFA